MTRTRKLAVTTGFSIALTALCLFITWVPGRFFHSPRLALFVSQMLFPFCHLGWAVHAGQGGAAFPSWFWFVWLQFPLYGLFVCLAWFNNRMRVSLLAVTVIHALAIIAAVGAHLYGAG